MIKIKFNLKKIIKFFLAYILLKIMLLITIYSIGVLYINTAGPLITDKIVIIAKGSSSRQIAQHLGHENIIKHDYFFWLISYITGKASGFKAGEYEFKKGVKPKEIMEILNKGLIVIHKLTIPEGMTNKAVIDLIDQQKALSGNINDSYPEGYLIGNTYFYIYGDRKQMIIDKIYQDSIKFIDQEWEMRDPKITLKNKNEAVILASIIEKEAILPQEQPIIAGVFYNRLKINMKLQADPTVVYALTLGQTKLDRLLTKNDTKINSLYNTYYVKGLPPTAIANPGKGAIRAALHPANHSYLYFVTDGRLGHNFSTSLEQHNVHFSNYKQKRKSD